jgi:hypothetical protein
LGKELRGRGGIEKMGWKIIDRLREEKWFVFLFSILLLLNVGCDKKSSGGEGISNKEISNEEISKSEKCPVWYKDADGDGYTDGTTKVSCSKPSDEYVSSATPGDCNDNDPNINPGKTEICDNKDNNCNGQIDEGDVCSFAKTIGGSDDDVAFSIIQSSDGGYVVAGWTKSFGAGYSDMYVVKLDSSGNVQWTKTIGGSKDDLALSIIQSSDGGYVVAGWTKSFGAGSLDMYVVKLDSSGNVQWTKTIGGGSSLFAVDYAFSIIQSSDGGYVVAGKTLSFGAGGYDFYVVKLDSSGNVQWTKTIGGSDWDEARSIIQSSDGGYVVAGYTYSFGADYSDIYVVKLDSWGNVQWTKTIGGSVTDVAYSIIQSSDGRYVVAGWTSSFGAGDDDFYVVKMDDNGNVCFSQNITNYSVSSNVGSFSSPSPVVISQSPTVKSISPTVSYGGSVSDVCALAKAPYLNICSASQDCDSGSAIATNKENVKSYGCSAGSVLSRFLLPASMLIIYYRFRKKKKRKS